MGVPPVPPTPGLQYNEIPTCSTCHVPCEILLRYLNTTQRFFRKCGKKSVSILHVVDMPFEETDNLTFFYRAVLPDLSDSRRNQKNLRTEN